MEIKKRKGLTAVQLSAAKISKAAQIEMMRNQAVIQGSPFKVTVPVIDETDIKATRTITVPGTEFILGDKEERLLINVLTGRFGSCKYCHGKWTMKQEGKYQFGITEYIYVRIPGNNVSYLLHVLIANLAGLHTYDKDWQIHHLDEVKTNCSIYNLIPLRTKDHKILHSTTYYLMSNKMEHVLQGKTVQQIIKAGNDNIKCLTTQLALMV